MLNMFKPTEIRTVKENKKLGSIFGWLGGYVNGVAILLLGNTVAHMSGNLAKLGKGFAGLNWAEVFVILPLIACFICGAMVGTYFYRRYGYQPVLVSEAIMLLLMSDLHFKVAIIVGAMAMGLQNAVTTCMSNDIVRTSHLTSTSTDIGISLARKDKTDATVKIITVSSYMWGAAVGVFVSNIFGLSAFSFAGVVIMALMAADLLRKTHDDDYLSLLYRKIICKILDL